MEPKRSTIGAPKPSAIAARSPGQRLARRRDHPRRDPQPAGPPLRGQAGQHRRVPGERRCVEAFSRSTMRGSGHVAGTPRNRNGRSPPAVHSGALPVACTADGAATNAIGRPPGGGRPAPTSRAVSDRVNEETNARRPRRSKTIVARRPGAAARAEREVLVEDRRRHVVGRGQRLLDRAPATAADRCRRRRGGPSSRPSSSPAASPGRRARTDRRRRPGAGRGGTASADRMAQQAPQAVPLPLLEPIGVPAQALDAGGQLVEQCLAGASRRIASKASAGRAVGHRATSSLGLPAAAASFRVEPEGPAHDPDQLGPGERVGVGGRARAPRRRRKQG